MSQSSYTESSNMETPGEESPLLSENRSVSGYSSDGSATLQPDEDSIIAPNKALCKSKAPGLERIQLIAAQISTVEKIWLFFFITLAGFANSLEGQLRFAYLPYAAASFQVHPYISIINVLRNVLAVAIYPTAARMGDIIGRFEILVVASTLYVLGMAVESHANSFQLFCVGTLIYQLGNTIIFLFIDILVADFSSMRARVFLNTLAISPYLINAWLSGSVSSAVLSLSTWRLGIGMWCLAFPLAILPLFAFLYALEWRYVPSLKKDMDDAWSQSWTVKVREQIVLLLGPVDAVGIMALVTALALILGPLTRIGDIKSPWENPQILVPVLLGVFTMGFFIKWELVTENPLVPFHLLKDRGVWSALLLRFFLMCVYSIQNNYLYTVLVVAFDFSVLNATRITCAYACIAVISSIPISWVIYKIRRLKVIVVTGWLVMIVTFLGLVRFHGGTTDFEKTGFIMCQVLLGIGAACIVYPAQALVQASAKSDHVTILTSLSFSLYTTGTATGTCLSGAVWTGSLLRSLTQNLAFQPDKGLAQALYDDPFLATAFPVGTEIRSAIIESFSHVQQLLVIAGLFVSLPAFITCMALRNPKLSDATTQEEAEQRLDDEV